ncbi:MAG: Mut7-C RNAse domain-containing protein, partial [Deltaproteobacteria bacterium]
EQELREITALFKAPQGVFLSRCIRCNEALIKIPKEDASGLVPVYVYETQEGFSKCPSCRRVYWTGTHRREMLKELKKLLGGDYEG